MAAVIALVLAAVGVGAVLIAAWALGGCPATKRGLARRYKRNKADLKSMRGPQLRLVRGGRN